MPRKAPILPAKEFDLKDRRKGLDGKTWVVTGTRDRKRWVRYINQKDCQKKKGMRYLKSKNPPCTRTKKTTKTTRTTAKRTTKKRMAPAVPAKECDVGDKKKGMDGKTWIVAGYKVNGKKHKRWTRVIRSTKKHDYKGKKHRASRSTKKHKHDKDNMDHGEKLVEQWMYGSLMEANDESGRPLYSKLTIPVMQRSAQIFNAWVDDENDKARIHRTTGEIIEFFEPGYLDAEHQYPTRYINYLDFNGINMNRYKRYVKKYEESWRREKKNLEEMNW